jgi:hypothetical protein
MPVTMREARLRRAATDLLGNCYFIERLDATMSEFAE